MSALAKLGVFESTTQEPIPYSETQAQTQQAFGFQWSMRSAFESEAVQQTTRDWLFERYCGGEPEQLGRWLGRERRLILDAGCGAGLSGLLFFGDHLHQHDYLGVDIAPDAIDVARQRFQEHGYPADFLNVSLLDLPLADASLDMIFSEGVLHHTDDTRTALHYLAEKLKPGGYFLFYVYAKKAVVREFTDDHIRAFLKDYSDEEAWALLEPLTKLGRALGDLQATIEVPEDIPFLGIRKGTLDVQRFFYWNICKLFYRPDFTDEELNHINFDWFRPLNCHRHTPEEIQAWCQEARLDIRHQNVQEAGITIVAQKY